MRKNKSTGIAAVIFRELDRIASRPIFILMTLILPLLSFGILWAIFHEGVPRDLPIAVYDADNSAMSRRLARMIDATPSIQVFCKVPDINAGKKLILSGKCYGLIVIPKNMEQDVFSGRAPHVVGYYNNQLMLPGSIISRDMRYAVGTLSAGLNMRLRQKKGEMTMAAKAHLEPIHVESHTLFNPYMNYMYFLLNTLLPTMLQIFVITVTVYALGIELKEGTAKNWLQSSGGSTFKAITGKLLPYSMVFFLLGLFINTFLYRYLGVPLKGSVWFIMIATFFFILAYQSVGLLLVTATANLRLATSFAVFYSAPAFAFVGITFPIMAMPLLGKIWSGILPLTYYLKIVIDQSMRGAPIIVSFPSLMVLVVFSVSGPLLAMPRMNKLMKNKRFWGKI